MDEYIRYREGDRAHDAPHLKLEIKASSRMYLTTSYHFESKIHYESTLPTQDEPIAVRFDVETAIKQGRFTLLHSVNDDEFEVIHVPIHVKDSLADYKQNIRLFRRDINPGEASGGQLGSLPDVFYDVLQVGETYVLLWPGDEIDCWDCGPEIERKDESVAKEQTNPSKKSGVVLPATSKISFTVCEHDDVWPDREEYARTHSRSWTNFLEWQWRAGRGSPPPPPPMLTVNDRAPDAPRLTRTLRGAPILFEKSKDGYAVEITTTYEADDTSQGRPITLFDPIQDDMCDGKCFRLMWHNEHGPSELDIDYLCDFGAAERDRNAPMDVRGSDEFYAMRFYTLSPGESMVNSFALFEDDWPYRIWNQLYEQKLTYRFDGKVVQWWDWGTLEDHKNTTVRGLETSHDRRPKIVIPGSSYDFTVVE